MQHDFMLTTDILATIYALSFFLISNQSISCSCYPLHILLMFVFEFNKLFQRSCNLQRARAVEFVPPPCLDTKVGRTCQMPCFIPLSHCQVPSQTFFPSLQPAGLGVLPSPRIHWNLPCQRSSLLSSSNQISLCVLLIIAPLAINFHVMSLIWPANTHTFAARSP
jgi:hypothetical protein